MSLATRCTECGTVFRVVQDQLKVSEGWVRCGRCSAVFNALENLCDLDSGAGIPAPAPGESRGRPAAPAPEQPSPDEHWPAADEAATAAPDAWEPTAAPSSFDHGTPGEAAHMPEAPPAAPFDDSPAAIVTFSAESPAEAAEPAAATTEPAPAAKPQFLRAADRAAYWRRPKVRAALGLGSVLLLLLLAFQATLAWRDQLAARVPAAAPTLVRLCQSLGCSVSPLRRIERLSVDSSGLTRIEGAALYRLSVVLHNRADTALMAPALDLTLTDGQGRLVARRVLQGSELGIPPVLAAGQELPLQATLSTGDRRISGYTVELFYP